MANLVFDDKTVLDILRHEHPQFYTLQMVEGPDVMVSIDKMIQELYENGHIEIKYHQRFFGFFKPYRKVFYNGDWYDDEQEMRTQITTRHVLDMVGGGLVGYTEIEPLNETV